jgi:hypothetical protein
VATRFSGQGSWRDHAIWMIMIENDRISSLYSKFFLLGPSWAHFLSRSQHEIKGNSREGLHLSADY